LSHASSFCNELPQFPSLPDYVESIMEDESTVLSNRFLVYLHSTFGTAIHRDRMDLLLAQLPRFLQDIRLPAWRSLQLWEAADRQRQLRANALWPLLAPTAVRRSILAFVGAAW
jgi:hypothetical protein